MTAKWCAVNLHRTLKVSGFFLDDVREKRWGECSNAGSAYLHSPAALPQSIASSTARLARVARSSQGFSFRLRHGASQLCVCSYLSRMHYSASVGDDLVDLR